MNTEIKILKANHGDCILIKTYDSLKNEFNILVDGGTSKTFDYALRKELVNLKVIHLLVLTHIDSDHIAGILRFLKSSFFKNINVERYWINSKKQLKFLTGDKISFSQGITLENLLIEKKEHAGKWNEKIFYGKKNLAQSIEAEILSPTEEILDLLHSKWPDFSLSKKKIRDEKISSGQKSQISKGSLKILARDVFKPTKSINSDLVNSASIAFHLKTPDCSILLLGDSRAEIVISSLQKFGYTNENPLNVDYVKISHHGSLGNTSCELLDLINCDNYIISSNGGVSAHTNPDRETIARIIHHPNRNYKKRRTIYFNYPLDDIEKKTGKLISEDDLKIGNWRIKSNIQSLGNDCE